MTRASKTPRPKKSDSDSTAAGGILALEKSKAGNWKILIADRTRLIEVLGESLTVAFAACFVHADRLSALLSWALLTGKAYGNESASFRRNIDAMLWFTIGTLREFEFAIDALIRELRGASIDYSSLSGWQAVKALQQWSKGRLPHRIRNEFAFHVDDETIRKGLRELAQSSEPWVFSEGDEPQGTIERMNLEFGRAPLVMGFDLEIDESVIRDVQAHQTMVPIALEQFFSEVLALRGLVPLEDEAGGSTSDP